MPGFSRAARVPVARGLKLGVERLVTAARPLGGQDRAPPTVPAAHRRASAWDAQAQVAASMCTSVRRSAFEAVDCRPHSAPGTPDCDDQSVDDPSTGGRHARMEDDRQVLAENVKAARQGLALSQEALADIAAIDRT